MALYKHAHFAMKLQLTFVIFAIYYSLAKEIYRPHIDVTFKQPLNNYSRPENGKHNDFYAAVCSAHYPVQWNLTGYISKSSFWVGTLNEMRSFTYRIVAFLDRASSYEYSLSIKCYSIETPSVFNETFAFHWNGTGSSLVEPDSNTVINSYIIPCATLSPETEVSLYLTTSDGEKKNVKLLDNSLEYRPTEGFISQNVFDSLYTCVQNTFNITITAISTLSDEFQSTPRKDFIVKSADETIRFECSSASGHSLQIIIFDTFSWNWPYNGEKYLVGNSSLNVSSQNIGNSITTDIKVISDLKFHIDGKAKCVANVLPLNETKIVKEWTFMFLEAPILHLNHQHRKVECISKHKVKISVMWCEDIKKCSLCRDQWDKKIVNCPRNFYGYEIENSTFVARSSYSQHIGWAICYIPEVMKHWIILETLDLTKRLSWMDAKTEELVNMHEVPEVLYTNVSFTFNIEILQYIFPMPPTLYVEVENKSWYSIPMPPDSIIENVPHIRKKIDTGKYKHVQIFIKLEMELYIDVVALHCLVRWWNSSEIFSVSRRFVTRHLRPPEFEESGDVIGSSGEEVFMVGDTNRRLSCVAKGEPTPQIRWYFNNTDVLMVLPELQLISCHNGKCHLDFPKIHVNDTARFTGEYMCTANNSVGTISKMIFLTIEEKKEQPEDAHLNLVYVSTGIVGVIIILALLTTLVIMTRRYRISKYLLRNLTQSEIDDFYEGRPGMNINGTSVETVDLMPFNKDYEIPLSDLHFTFSDASLLGSGEFAFVVRGLLLSSGKPVALKISKPSTDVTLFKSMLSEVKIMTYIGHHDNVLSLIGVCTEEIRSRSLYIVTDICELGSLKSFLHKCKPQFVNLINANQEIDVSLLPQELSRSDDCVTTLDLIDFCAQIARGMEYLAYKSVIHADLATRNVLLTNNRIAKISDFGLSRKLYESSDYVKKSRSPLPWRWMAVESLEKLTFSTKSDVWSYGVTLYEIFTLGNAPFPNENWSHEFVSRLKTGMRMGRPEFSTPEIYTRMVACWENEPDLRPEFGTLRSFFENLLARNSA